MANETEFDLFVPATDDTFGMDVGSAIVAPVSQRGQPHVLVHYEGNRFGAANLRQYSERCLHAAGRAAQRYPTIAKAMLPFDGLVQVGTYDLATQQITAITDPEMLVAWLGDEPLPAIG